MKEFMNSVQKARLLEYLNEYIVEEYGPGLSTTESSEDSYDEFDKKRDASIPELNKLVTKFLSGKIDISEFKDEHGFKCREFPYWGFKGCSGQMQLNQLVKNIEDDEKEPVFKNALRFPKTEKEAQEKIDYFSAYISEKRISASNASVLPRVGSVAYMLSYFWEIQNKSLWPVFYNSSKIIFDELGFIPEGKETIGQQYIWFVGMMKEIADLYKSNASVPIKNPFWFVEHVFFTHFLKSSAGNGAAPNGTSAGKVEAKTQKLIPGNYVANEWLPPIIADLCDLALNKETEWSKRNSLKPEKAFESKVRIAFTLLGYEAFELGQGKGRESDGFAISLNADDGDYAIIYDAKAREDKFSVGTNDRQIYEYIKNPPDELKKRRMKPICFLIVSSQFDDSQVNLSLIRDVDRRTNTRVVMISASDFLFVIEEKLKNFELNHTRLQQLFVETGILTREKIVNF